MRIFLRKHFLNNSSAGGSVKFTYIELYDSHYVIVIWEPWWLFTRSGEKNLINSNTVKNQVQTKNQRIAKISPMSWFLNITRTNLSIMLCYVMVCWRGSHCIFPKRCITKLRLSHMILACVADLCIIKIVHYHLNHLNQRNSFRRMYVGRFLGFGQVQYWVSNGVCYFDSVAIARQIFLVLEIITDCLRIWIELQFMI